MNKENITKGKWVKGSDYVFLSGTDLIIADLMMSEDANKANAQLIAEAGNVFNECGLTPRELLDMYNEAMKVVSSYEKCCGLMRMPYEDELKNCNMLASSIIKKHKEVIK